MIKLTSHAKERAIKYNILKQQILDATNNPDNIIETYNNRRIYQKMLNGHVLRVIVEEEKQLKTIVTVYKARRKRYGI